MKPLFETVLIRLEKKKPEEVDDPFLKTPEKPKNTAEVTVVEFADDCNNQVYTLRDKKVLWNKMALDVISETDEHQLILVRQNSLLMEL